MDTKLRCPNLLFSARTGCPSHQSSLLLSAFLWFVQLLKGMLFKGMPFLWCPKSKTDQGRGKKAQSPPELKNILVSHIYFINSMWGWLKLFWLFFAVWPVPLTKPSSLTSLFYSCHLLVNSLHTKLHFNICFDFKETNLWYLVILESR